jgi:hypothetical protein
MPAPTPAKNPLVSGEPVVKEWPLSWRACEPAAKNDAEFRVAATAEEICVEVEQLAEAGRAGLGGLRPDRRVSVVGDATSTPEFELKATDTPMTTNCTSQRTGKVVTFYRDHYRACVKNDAVVSASTSRLRLHNAGGQGDETLLVEWALTP